MTIDCVDGSMKMKSPGHLMPNKQTCFSIYLVRADIWVKNAISYIIYDEPPHDKTNNVVVRPAKTQISLGIRPV